jgi:hypothetical protein
MLSRPKKKKQAMRQESVSTTRYRSYKGRELVTQRLPLEEASLSLIVALSPGPECLDPTSLLLLEYSMWPRGGAWECLVT